MEPSVVAQQAISPTQPRKVSVLMAVNFFTPIYFYRVCWQAGSQLQYV